jgi:hypothetical protein
MSDEPKAQNKTKFLHIRVSIVMQDENGNIHIEDVLDGRADKGDISLSFEAKRESVPVHDERGELVGFKPGRNYAFDMSFKQVLKGAK